MARNLILSLDSYTLNNYVKNDFSAYDPDYKSSLSIIKGVYNHLSLSKVGFFSPESLKSHQMLYEIKDGRFVLTNESVEGDALIILGVDTEEDTYSLDDLKHQYYLYEQLSSKIGRFSNPLVSKFRISKKNLYNEVDNDLLPRRIMFSSWEDLSDSVRDEGQIVIKHDEGAGGDQVFLLNDETFDFVKTKVGDTVGEYVAQEFLNMISDKRIVIFGNEIAGSRIIYDRLTPWVCRDHVSQPKNHKHFVASYNPSKDEVDLAFYYFNKLDLDYGTFDMVNMDDGRQLIMEVNTIHPGMIQDNRGSPPIVYDLGDSFAKFLKTNFMNGGGINERQSRSHSFIRKNN